MKISNLLEMTTPSSDPTNMAGSQAPQFGRDPHVLEDETLEETTAGAISTGAATNMGMQTRGKGSMFQGIKTSKKFVNSPIKEAETDPEQEKIDSLKRSRQEKERGSERELGRDPKPSGQYYIMINGSSYKRDGKAVMFNSSIEAHRAVERIREFRKSKGWGTARYDVIQQKSMEEALDPKAISTLKQAKQSIAKNREADLSAWEQDFKKNFASKYSSQQPAPLAQRSLTMPAAKPAAAPLEKHSVLKSRLEKLKAVTERQKYLDYLTFKAEQKGLLNPRLEADIDTSMYVKGAEKDDYQALSQKIEKSIELMKNRLGINKLAYKKPKPMREEDVTEAELDEACWKGYHKEGNKKMFGKTYPNCVKNTNEEQEQLDEKCWDTHKQVGMKNKGGRQVPNCVPKESIEESHSESCPHCGGEMVSEDLINEKKDACYYKVKSRYKVWPSAYASGALVKCRKSGASNWGDGDKKNESVEEIEENLHKWFKEKWVRFGPDGKIRGDCARGDDSEGKPKCLPQSKAQNLGKKGRASAASRKRREDPNPERSGKAINVNTKKKSNEGVAEGKYTPASETEEDIFIKGKKVGKITKITTKKGMVFYRAEIGNSSTTGADTREEAIRDLKRLISWKNKKGVAEGFDVMEAELSEEQLLASELKKRLDLFGKGKDKQLGSKPKDRGIMTKEGQMSTESLPKEYIEKAIYRVLTRKFPEVINQYGAPIVGDAISSVADMHKDIENIQAEEASIMLHQVVNQLNRHLQMREATVKNSNKVNN